VVTAPRDSSGQVPSSWSRLPSLWGRPTGDRVATLDRIANRANIHRVMNFVKAIRRKARLRRSFAASSPDEQLSWRDDVRAPGAAEARGHNLTRGLLVLIACTIAFDALFAGGATFRVLVDLPARHRIGPLAFQEFSRATDLSRGLVYYPIGGIGSAVLTVTTWIVALRHGVPRRVSRLLALAAGCSLLVLVFTIPAAPLMFRIGSAPGNPQLVSSLLDRFTRWTIARAVWSDVAMLAMIAAMAAFVLPPRQRSLEPHDIAVAVPQSASSTVPHSAKDERNFKR
jgi:hypothetical protein